MTAVSSEGLPEEHDLPSDAENGRMCIVTRESGSPDELIRFVAAPDGTVVAGSEAATAGPRLLGQA